MSYDPITQAVRDDLLNGRGVAEIQGVHGARDFNKSTAILMTYESLDNLEKMFGKPGSDLEVLCAKGIENSSALTIYQNIGVPHYFAHRYAALPLVPDGIALDDIPEGIEKTDMYEYASKFADCVFCHEEPIFSPRVKQQIQSTLKYDEDNSFRYDAFMKFDREEVKRDITASFVLDNIGRPNLKAAAIEAFSYGEWDEDVPPLVVLLSPGGKGRDYLHRHGQELRDTIEKSIEAYQNGKLPAHDASDYVIDCTKAAPRKTQGLWLEQYIQKRHAESGVVKSEDVGSSPSYDS